LITSSILPPQQYAQLAFESNFDVLVEKEVLVPTKQRLRHVLAPVHSRIPKHDDRPNFDWLCLAATRPAAEVECENRFFVGSKKSGFVPLATARFRGNWLELGEMNHGHGVILSEVIAGNEFAWVALNNVGGIGVDLAILNMDYLPARETPLAGAKVYTYNRKCSHQILSAVMETLFIMGGAKAAFNETI
jgi:hypothetical protein